MSIIKFTRMERDGTIIRRYGELSFIATPDRCYATGTMTSSPNMHGDKEFEVMAEECSAIWADHLSIRKKKAAPYEPPSMNRGAGTHQKVGPYRVVQGIGCIIKVSGRETEIKMTDCPIGEATSQVFLSLIADRDEVRAEFHRWSREKAA